MSILITGFEPFAGESTNPSWQVAQLFHGKYFENHETHAYCLPTAFGESLRVLEELIDLHKPSIVICIGQAGGRHAVSLERVAINIDDARIADNLGKNPIDTPVKQNGPNAYFSTLPIKSIVHNLHQSGIPAEVSNSAGTFVCNHVFYGLMHYVAGYSNIKAGFIHIPYLPEQAVKHKAAPSMAIAILFQSIEIAIQTSLLNSQDLRISGGTIC